MHLNGQKKHKIIPVAVEDKHAINAVIHFLNDQRLLVEVSCAAGLALVYEESLFEQHKLLLGDNILVIICGGNIINLDYLIQLKTEYCSSS